MSRPKNETPTKKVTVMMTHAMLNALDQAALEARIQEGVAVDRSRLIAAIVESVDIHTFARDIAAGVR